jgi:hypothetical protein
MVPVWSSNLQKRPVLSVALTSYGAEAFFKCDNLQRENLRVSSHGSLTHLILAGEPHLI